MSGPRIALATGVACVLAFALAPSAQASVTIGQTAPHPESAFCGRFFPFDDVTQTVASGPSFAVPAGGGVITAWSTMGGKNGGKPQVLGLDVLRRTGYATYTKVAADGPRPVTPEAMNSFPVEIPVKGGDLIGIRGPSFGEGVEAPCFFETGDPNDEEGFAEPGIAVGKSAEFRFGGNELPDQHLGDLGAAADDLIAEPTARLRDRGLQGDDRGGQLRQGRGRQLRRRPGRRLQRPERRHDRRQVPEAEGAGRGPGDRHHLRRDDGRAGDVHL